MNAETTSPCVETNFDPFDDAENWNALESRMRDWDNTAPKTVLLIGQDTAETQAFAQAIDDAGFSCRTCNSGSEALRSSRAKSFPVVAIRRGLPDVGGDDLARILRTHNLPEAEFVLLETDEAQTAATEVEQAHAKRLKTDRKNRFYGETLGGALYTGLSRLKRQAEEDDHARHLRNDFRQELEKLASSDSEITRDEDSFKNFLADSLHDSEDDSPEGLLERAIQAVKDLNDKQAHPVPAKK